MCARARKLSLPPSTLQLYFLFNNRTRTATVITSDVSKLHLTAVYFLKMRRSRALCNAPRAPPLHSLKNSSGLFFFFFLLQLRDSGWGGRNRTREASQVVLDWRAILARFPTHTEELTRAQIMLFKWWNMLILKVDPGFVVDGCLRGMAFLLTCLFLSWWV